MLDDSKRDGVAAAMRRINETWLDGRVEDLTPMLHPEIVMVFPGFTARSQGRKEFLAGFQDFRRNATIHDFSEHDYQIDVAGDTAVINFGYEMVYERTGRRYHASGRDLWVFQRQGGGWVAVWRTMVGPKENAV